MGGLTGSSKTSNKLPQWFEDAAKNQLGLGQKVAQTGYVPYMGPEVAAFSPQQVMGMQQAADWSAAFGGKGAKPLDVAKSIPKPQQFAGGLTGYSSYGGYQQQLQNLKKTYPGLYKYISQFSIDPITGAPAAAFAGLTNLGSGGGGGGGDNGKRPPVKERTRVRDGSRDQDANLIWGRGR